MIPQCRNCFYMPDHFIGTTSECGIVYLCGLTGHIIHKKYKCKDWKWKRIYDKYVKARFQGDAKMEHHEIKED